MFSSPGDEVGSPRIDDAGVFLIDGLDAGIGTGKLDAAQAIENPHDGFLEDHHSMRLAENLLHYGVWVGRLFATVFALDVFIHHAAFERARTIERCASDDVPDVVGLHSLQQFTDAFGLKLEYTLRISSLQ